MYLVFVRNWWRKDELGKLVPNAGGRRHTLRRVSTEQEAREICREYNATHIPGKLSRKAEYTRE